MTVGLDGFFALMWFGWGQANGPLWRKVPLLVGTAVGALVAVLGAVVAARAPGQRTPMANREIRMRYT